jgi:hypothetical protein
MAQIGLDRPRIAAIVRKLVTAGMTQHVGMSLDAQICRSNCPLHQTEKARVLTAVPHAPTTSTKRRPWAFSLMPAELAHLPTTQGCAAMISMIALVYRAIAAAVRPVR